MENNVIMMSEYVGRKERSMKKAKEVARKEHNDRVLGMLKRLTKITNDVR